MSGQTPDTLELLHADIDGLISESDREVLRRRLEEDAELSALHADLKRLNEGLNEMAQLAPPTELVNKVIAEIPESKTKTQTQNSIFELINSWFAPQVVRYAFSFVCGVIVAGAIMQMRLLDDAVSQVASLPGTMLPVEQMTPLSSLQVSHEDVSGTVELSRAGSLLSLAFSLQANRDVELVLGFDGNQLDLDGFSQPTGEITSLSMSGGKVTVSAVGEQVFVVQLEDSGAAGSTIEVSVLLGGDEIRRASFDTDTGLSK